MSRCAHRQSDYRLRALPTCSRCKIEFILTMAKYENSPPIEEWECPKCHKAVPRNFLREQPPSDWEAWLHKWCINDRERRQRIADRNKAM